MPGTPFDIDVLPDSPLQSAGLLAARPLLSWVLGLRTYRALYARAQALQHGPFDTRALEALDIQVSAAGGSTRRIPAHGPLVVAANHPHGMLDGLALLSLVHQVRPDVRVLTNHLLSRIPELADLCFFVDPFGGPDASARSRAGLRAAHLWLKRGGALIVFPAGEVAHVPRSDGGHSDSPWSSTTGRLVLGTGAKVLPAFIAGGNSTGFYAAGRIHPALRTLLLARELLGKRGLSVSVRFGEPLTADLSSPEWVDADAATRWIRRAADRLAGAPRASEPAALEPTDAIAADVSRLSSEACLVESGAFQVFCARAHEIPSALREIGRLRELTYRAVGEGTGRALDLDAFDDRYLHLFVWDRNRRSIAGAYRIGQTDRIVAEHGPGGLYTRTLFRYDDRLLARLSPALELGRSFVRAEYQKHSSALLLLWKGIGRFVLRHPEYRVLFGPVSISSRYSDHSQALLMTFLQLNHLDHDLAPLVEAVHPSAVTPGAPTDPCPCSIDEANRLVAQTEADGKGVPVLLRQYLKLNARLIGFNVDPQFGDALDALMMVDLTAVDPAILTRYFGRQGAADLLARHRPAATAHAA